jgi:hypothetical protein
MPSNIDFDNFNTDNALACGSDSRSGPVSQVNKHDPTAVVDPYLR